MADPTREPIEPEALEAIIRSALTEIRVSTIAHVVRFDASKGTVDVKPAILTQVDTKEGRGVEELPEIKGVRVYYVSGGGWSVTHPLNAGDPVRLIFSNQYTGNYRYTGTPGQDPGFLAMFDLSSCIAVPCEERNKNPPVVSASEMVFGGPGVFRFGGPSAEFLAVASKVYNQLTALSAAIDAASIVEGNASGLGGMTALKTALETALWPQQVASSNIKAEP